MKVDAFFEGGGILGISFIGAYKALTDHGIYINRALGISSGSIVSSLIMAGYSANELIDLIKKYQDFSFLKQKTKVSNKGYIGKPLSLLLNKGIYDSEIIEKFMEKLLSVKNIYTFSDMMYLGESKLKILATDYTNKRLLLLPDDLPLYGNESDDFSIAKAIRMSCAIPFFYTPCELRCKYRNNLIIDGGVIKHIPTSIINHYRELNQLTLRFRIKDEPKAWQKKIKDLSGQMIEQKEQSQFERVITIHHDKRIKSTNFNISLEDMKYLFKQGYKACYRFLKKEFNQ